MRILFTLALAGLAASNLLAQTSTRRPTRRALPEGYWPDRSKEASPDDWRRTVEGVRAETRRMEALVEDESNDLHAAIPHGDGQTLLREALLVADHNAYHLGALVTLGRALKAAREA